MLRRAQARLALLPVVAVVVLPLVWGLYVSPLAVTVTVIVVAFLAIVAFRPEWLFPTFLVVAFTTTPAIVPQVVQVGPIPVFLYEIPLYAAAVAGFERFTRTRARIVVLLLALAWLGMLTLGVTNHHSVSRLVQDARPTFDFVIAAVASSGYLARFRAQTLVPVVATILALSAAMSLLASLTGLALTGRSEIASLTSTTEGAERLLTAASFPAVAVLCVALTALLLGGASIRSVGLRLIAPAILLILLAFSRNNVIGLAVSVLWALVAAHPLKKVQAAGRFLIIGISTVGTVALLTVTNASPWLEEQLGAFATRVFNGLSSSTLASDTSAQFREQEIAQILPQIAHSPVFGQGFGAIYKAPLPPAGSFFAVEAPAYSHNAYLWLALKGGWIVSALFVVLLIIPALAAFGSRDWRAIAASGALLTCATICLVAPLPLGYPSASFMGVVFGAGYFFSFRVPEDLGLAYSRTRDDEVSA